MITIKSPREIETMAAAGHIVAATLALVARHVRPGISTEELEPPSTTRWSTASPPPSGSSRPATS